ncbi:MAG: hypothetical protein SPD81_05790 [Candidatus Faecousia sp.]|nr:hypothetical protein [Candidatus Faecousia sp.]
MEHQKKSGDFLNSLIFIGRVVLAMLVFLPGRHRRKKGSLPDQ